MYPDHDDATGRKQIHVKVCPAAWEGWERYARKEGVTLAALLDAIGHYLAHLDPAKEGAKGIMTSVPAAREIDADRRRRG